MPVADLPPEAPRRRASQLSRSQTKNFSRRGVVKEMSPVVVVLMLLLLLSLVVVLVVAAAVLFVDQGGKKECGGIEVLRTRRC